MACFTVLFIVALTASKVALLRCPDQQLPASGDDMQLDFKKVTTLQYCLVDNCTIKMIDTGEKLNIVYTTDSLLVTTPMDDHTSTVIARPERELPCVGILHDGQIPYVQLAIVSLVTVISGYIVAVHVAFKELRNVFGKLLMLHSVATVGTCISFFSLLPTMLQLVTHSLVYCYVRMVCFSLSSVSLEALATCIFSHIAITMHNSYKMRSQMSKETSQHHFRSYMIYMIGMALLVLFLTISFDLSSHNYKDTLLPNGQCATTDDYGTIVVNRHCQ